jgi:hypothetical protein
VKKSKHRQPSPEKQPTSAVLFLLSDKLAESTFFIESYDPSPAGRFDILIPTNLVLGSDKVLCDTYFG